MIEIEKNTTVYILCPAYLKTGGTELVHQLAHTLDNNDIDVYMVYLEGKENNTIYRPGAFDKYIKKECKLAEISDDEKNIVILPEIYPYMRRKWKKIRTAIWWMSVDHYVNNNGIINPIKNRGIIFFLKRLLRKKISLTTKDIKSVNYHLVQSYYANDYVLKQGIAEEKIYYLSDYINSEFMNKKLILKIKKILYCLIQKKDIILHKR